jgi:hypothetical protein
MGMNSSKDNRVDSAAAMRQSKSPVSPRIAHAILRELHGYWLTKKKGDSFPSRTEIDPIEMPRLLPNVILVDVLRDPLRFQIRLMGTECEAGYGADATGQSLDTLDFGNRAGDILEDHRNAALSREPLCKSYDFTKWDGHDVRFELLLLPLSSDGSNVDMLLGGMAFGADPAI